MRTRLRTHCATEIRYARRSKHRGYVTYHTLRVYKDYCHREQRNNDKALVNEGLEELCLT